VERLYIELNSSLLISVSPPLSHDGSIWSGISELGDAHSINTRSMGHDELRAVEVVFVLLLSLFKILDYSRMT
jgi:hypothetical protein